MNAFYLLPKYVQWIVAVFMTMLFIGLVAIICWITYNKPVFGFLFLLVSPIFYLLTTPLFTLSGKYKYFSPLLFFYEKSNGDMEMHLGTNFDYAFVIIPLLFSKKNIRTEIKKYFIEGNLNFIDFLEKKSNEKSSVKVSTISHLINEKTKECYHAQYEKISLWEKIEYLFYTVDILWMHLFSCGFKKISRIYFPKKITSPALIFINRKEFFIKAQEKVKSKNGSFTLSQFKQINQYQYSNN